MKAFLDSNVWRYVADHDVGDELARVAAQCDIEIVVAPVLVFEAQALQDNGTRKKILELLAAPGWTRLMPEAFLEADEFKSVVRRLRPEWLIVEPDRGEVQKLRADWESTEVGFWSRARNDIRPSSTDESLRAEGEHVLAREEAEQVRQRVLDRKQPLPRISLREVYGVPPPDLRGWRGEPVEYWRVPSLYHLQRELAVYTSPYREWLDSEIDVGAIASAQESLTRLWFYEIESADAPRQWTRGAFEYLQAFHKVTAGNPVDSQLASHLVDVDAVVSADRNFVRFAQKCHDDAPFQLAMPFPIAGGTAAIGDLLDLLRRKFR